jgi:DNA modification methylase
VAKKSTAHSAARAVKLAQPDLKQLTRLAIQHCPMDILHPDPLNPRQHNNKQVHQIADSITIFGFNVPVLVDQHLNVIAGHGRLLAARLLGMTEVPTIRLDHLSPQQVRAFMIADNKLSENSSWDDALLAEQLKTLTAADLDFSLETIGFEMGEIDAILEGVAPVRDVSKDPADSIPEDAKSRVATVRDLWLLGKNRVLCGDALDPAEYSRLMSDQRAAVVFTDPPYNVPIYGHASGLGKKQHHDFVMGSGEMSEPQFTTFLSNVCNLLARYTHQGSIHFICMDWRHMRELLTAGREAYTQLKNICVWTKDNAGMGSLYRSQHEFVFVFKSGKCPHRNNVQLGQYGRYRTNVWRYAGVNSFSRNTEEGNLLELHPTVKPVALVADAIMDVSDRGDVVLDPFLGSGTTLIACERTGRTCYGIELDPLYVDTIVRRWQKFTGLSATHAASGRSFNELEKEVADEQRQ